MMNFLKRYRKELFTNKKINVTKKTHEFKTDFIFRQNDNLNKNRSIFKDYFNSNTFKYKEKLLLKIIVLVFILSIEISCNLHYVFAEGTANKETVIKSSEYYELKYRDITTSHYEVTVSDAVFSQIELMKMFHITSVKDSLSRIEENLNSLPNNFKDALINRTGLLIRYKDSHFQVLDMTREISAVKTQNVKVKNY
ncbi:MAG: hypothetical protein LBM02_00485, partial [Lachnospiraceae bacterium]|nr:hypothetical protein [Lachnospiraceae bacterium]